jgi:uncharacterized tellurite resistance protein B-like protein
MLNTVRSWLGLTEAQAPDHSPLRGVIDALDRLEPERARYLARFAYLLGRVAHADRHVSPEETAAMEEMVRAEGRLSPDQAMLVVSLAKSSNALFGGTADFTVAQEFNETATYEEKLALARCLFAVGATDASISLAEESEIHRITNQLKIDRADLTAIRLQHRQALPGIARPDGD